MLSRCIRGPFEALKDNLPESKSKRADDNDERASLATTPCGAAPSTNNAAVTCTKALATIRCGSKAESRRVLNTVGSERAPSQ